MDKCGCTCTSIYNNIISDEQYIEYEGRIKIPTTLKKIQHCVPTLQQIAIFTVSVEIVNIKNVKCTCYLIYDLVHAPNRIKSLFLSELCQIFRKQTVIYFDPYNIDDSECESVDFQQKYLIRKVFLRNCILLAQIDKKFFVQWGKDFGEVLLEEDFHFVNVFKTFLDNIGTYLVHTIHILNSR